MFCKNATVQRFSFARCIPGPLIEHNHGFFHGSFELPTLFDSVQIIGTPAGPVDTRELMCACQCCHSVLQSFPSPVYSATLPGQTLPRWKMCSSCCSPHLCTTSVCRQLFVCSFRESLCPLVFHNDWNCVPTVDKSAVSAKRFSCYPAFKKKTYSGDPM